MNRPCIYSYRPHGAAVPTGRRRPWRSGRQSGQLPPRRARVDEARSDPASNGHANSVSNQLPTRAPPRTTEDLGWQRPVWVESLQSLRVTDVGRNDSTVGEPDRWRRRNPEARPTLERWDAVNPPTDAAISFRPVEAACNIERLRLLWRTCVVGEENARGILRARGEKDDTLPSLRKAERTRVDDAVGPPISEVAKPAHEVRHRLTALQAEHERHVLQEEPCRRTCRPVDESKNVLDEARLRAADADRPADRAQVLARKARRYNIALRKLFEIADVSVDADSELCLEYGYGSVLYFTQKNGLVTSEMEPPLDPSDPGEETSDT